MCVSVEVSGTASTRTWSGDGERRGEAGFESEAVWECDVSSSVELSSESRSEREERRGRFVLVVALEVDFEGRPRFFAGFVVVAFEVPFGLVLDLDFPGRGGENAGPARFEGAMSVAVV